MNPKVFYGLTALTLLITSLTGLNYLQNQKVETLSYKVVNKIDGEHKNLRKTEEV